MNFVFYDTRTTGNQPGFDQILEIAAIHTDANFNGLDRLQAGCCLMPHIAPSPIALLASGAEASQFFDRTLGSHFELIGQIETTFRKWSPATFIQFNSKTSGDPMLRQALFQTLRDPDLMRSNGNRSPMRSILQRRRLALRRARWRQCAASNFMMSPPQMASPLPATTTYSRAFLRPFTLHD